MAKSRMMGISSLRGSASTRVDRQRISGHLALEAQPDGRHLCLRANLSIGIDARTGYARCRRRNDETPYG